MTHSLYRSLLIFSSLPLFNSNHKDYTANVQLADPLDYSQEVYKDTPPREPVLAEPQAQLAFG